jgi:hypothetical protein
VASLLGGPGADDFVIQLKPKDATTIEFSDDGGAGFVDAALAGITAVTVSGLQGKDTLTIDATNGLVGQAGGLPISFDGGAGHNVLVVAGNPGGMVTETFSAGTSRGSGTLDITNGTVSSTITLTQVRSVHDTMIATTLTINGNGEDNEFHLHNGPVVDGFKTDTVQIRNINDVNEDLASGQDDNGTMQNDQGDDQNDQGQDEDHSKGNLVSVSFANKTNVIVNGRGANNLFLVTVSKPAVGLQTLTLNGGSGTNVLAARQLPEGVTVTLNSIQLQESDPDAIFIEELYELRLGRAAAAAEVELWLNALQTAGPGAVARGIEESPEALTHLVKSWYLRYLGREAVNGEEQGWVGLLLAGQTEEQVMAGILGSGEFQSHAQTLISSGTSDERLVQALYLVLLNRTASATEVSGWASVLPSAGRNGVAIGFLESNEFRSDMTTAFYSTFLHRDPDPDGLNAWVLSGNNLKQIREGFESSSEFRGAG